MKIKLRVVMFCLLVVGTMFSFSASTYATKWVPTLSYLKDGKRYIVEECTRKFLSTDGCRFGDTREVEIPVI